MTSSHKFSTWLLAIKDYKINYSILVLVMRNYIILTFFIFCITFSYTNI